MQDSEIRISRGCAVASVAWGVAVVLIAAMWLTDDVRAGVTALAVVSVAGVQTVRQYFVTQNRILKNGFELGRDSVLTLARK